MRYRSDEYLDVASSIARVACKRLALANLWRRIRGRTFPNVMSACVSKPIQIDGFWKRQTRHFSGISRHVEVTLRFTPPRHRTRRQSTLGSSRSVDSEFRSPSRRCNLPVCISSSTAGHARCAASMVGARCVRPAISDDPIPRKQARQGAQALTLMHHRRNPLRRPNPGRQGFAPDRDIWRSKGRVGKATHRYP